MATPITTLRDALLGTAFRTALNAGLTLASLPTIANPALGETNLLVDLAYAPALPALAVEVAPDRGRRLASDNDYRHELDVTVTVALAEATRSGAMDTAADYAEVVRRVVLAQLDTAAASPLLTVQRVRYRGTDVAGEIARSDSARTCRWVQVRFEVWMDAGGTA